MADDPTKLSYDDMVSRWVARGYPEPAAKGIADNMMRESGGKTTEWGDNHTSYGLFQHHNERRTALESFAKAQDKPVSDPDVQIAFADQEMKRDYPKLRETLLKTDNRAEAEDSFKRIFERPASVMWQNNASGQPVLGNGRYRFSDSAYAEHDGKPNTALVYMPPVDYLDLSPPLAGRAMASSAGRSLRRSLDRGEPVESIPSLDVNVEGPTGTVTAQDGRHRALAAQEAGLTHIPVAINQTGEGSPSELVGMQGKAVPHAYPAAADVSRETKPDGSIWGTIKSAIIPSAQAAEVDDDPFAKYVQPAAADDPFAKYAQPKASEPPHDNMAMSIAKGAAQGLGNTVLAGQELVGHGLSAVGLSTPGEWLVNDARKGMTGLAESTAADRAAHPWMTGAGEILGGAAIPGGAAAKIGGNALKMGAVAGGIGGLLSPASNDGLSYGLEKAAQVAGGAAVGGVVGKGLDVALKYAQPIIRPIMDYVRNIKGESPLQSAAAQEILRRMAESAKGGGPTAQDMIDLIAKTPSKPLTLMDLGDPNLRSLAGRIARVPGEGSTTLQKFIAERDLNAGLRLKDDIGEALGTANSFDAADALAASRSRAAGPLYSEAYAANQSMDSPVLDHILKTPAGKSALTQARVKMQNDMDLMGSNDPDLTEAARQAATGQARGLKLRTLDYVKRAMDDQIGVAQRAGEKDNARILVGLKRELVNELDRIDATAKQPDLLSGDEPTPGAYARARAAYAGPSQTMEALDVGRNFLTMDPEEITRATAAMNAGDKEFFKLGAASAIRRMVAKTGPHGNEAIKLVGSGNEQAFIRQQLKAVFNDDLALNRFMDSVMAEHRMFQTGVDILGNSKTAQRMAEDSSPRAGAHEAMGRGAINMALGRPVEAVFNALRAAREWKNAPDPALHSAMAQMLIAPQRPTTAGSGMNLLREFATMAPSTRNFLRPGAGAAPLLAAPAQQATQQGIGQ